MYKVKYIICSEAYWLGALRWNERMRGEEPAVWLHWVGKDPVEICNKLPHPDENGICFFKLSTLQRNSPVRSTRTPCLRIVYLPDLFLN